MDCRTQIAGHRYGHGSQDMDTDMDRRTGITGHGHGHELQDMDMDMGTEFKRYGIQKSPVHSLSCVIN